MVRQNWTLTKMCSCMFYVILTLLFIVLRILFRDFRKNPAGSLINPLFLLLLFSLLYFLVPLLYLDLILETTQFPDSSVNKISLYLFSIWYILIFLFFYKKSNPIECNFSDISPSYTVYRSSCYIYYIINIILILIVILYVPSIYSLKEDRGAALNLYEGMVNSRFKLRILMYCHFCSIFIIFWKKKTLKVLLPCLLYFIIDYSHGGRTVSLMTLLFCYYIYILKTQKTHIVFFLIIILLLLIAGIIQRSSSDELLWNLYMGGAEFSNTYLTTVYLVDHPDYRLDGLSYFIVSLSKIFPGGMVDKMLGFGEWYGNELSNDIGLGYGLAGNLITEGLVYGGMLFAIINPILIGLVCFFINKMRHRKELFFILFSLILSVSMQNIVRSYFWGFILYPIQILCFYLIFFYQDYFKRVFK